MSYWKPGAERPETKVSVLPTTQNDSTATTARGSNSSGYNNDNKSSESSLLTSKLSKSVLGMKFMKTKVEVSTNQDLNAIKASLNWKKKKEDGQKSTDVSLSSIHSHEIKLSCTTDDFNFNAVLPGRRSFNGCNKAMERHYQMQLEQLKFQQTSIESNVTTASSNMDEEMIKKYEKLVGLPRGPSGGMMTDNDSKKRKLNQPDHRKKR